MSTDAFDDLLQRARSELTVGEQQRLAEQLSQSAGKDVPRDMGSETGKSLYDALNERGMIGSIIDGPGDLSTNPQYMEGFGQDGN
jgi:hypothetical protein